MSSSTSMPKPALALGLGGLLPFWALALALATGLTFGRTPDAVSSALTAYAAIILSFLGGIRWGIGVMQEDEGRAARNFLISVVPALLAWAVFALPPDWRLEALAALIILVGLFDYGLVCREEAPQWFGNLRLILSGVAGAALVLAAATT